MKWRTTNSAWRAQPFEVILNNIFQDNMIDEEKAKKEAAAQMTFEQKINLLNDQVFN